MGRDVRGKGSSFRRFFLGVGSYGVFEGLRSWKRFVCILISGVRLEVILRGPKGEDGEFKDKSLSEDNSFLNAEFEGDDIKELRGDSSISFAKDKKLGATKGEAELMPQPSLSDLGVEEPWQI